MRIAGLWRYPVKSMRGERLDQVGLTGQGVVGDRAFGLLDVLSGTVISAKKDGRLLEARALIAGEQLVIRLPNGETVFGTGPSVDTALSAWLGSPVRLIPAEGHGPATYESFSDYEDETSATVRWQGPAGSFVDSTPVHLLTSASLTAMRAERPELQWEVARFRPNLVIDVDGSSTLEQEWIGRSLLVGECLLRVTRPCSRCVMTTRPQPGGLERQLDVLRHINRFHAKNLGVRAVVERSGSVQVGDEVSLLEPSGA